MKETVHVYLGHQIDDHVLRRLREDLERRGVSARIVANVVAAADTGRPTS